ncbi:MAG: rhodanese-like domain-containing protein [Devosia sp.]|nr:rhodanese-like domain-containing protein [Devosia sp.]
MFNSLFKRPAASFENVNPRQILDWVGSKDVVFVDVRNPGEIAASGTVKGAVRIPLPAIDNFAKPDGSGKLPAADTGKAIVVFCASGMRSQSAAAKLADLGYPKVYNMGGFGGWVQAGGAVER